MAVRWKSYDTGLFKVEVPPGWVAEENPPGTVLVRDGQSEVAVTLSAVAKAGGEGRVISPKEVQAELEGWIGKQRQVRVRQAARQVSGTFHLTCTTEGLEQLRAGQSWWRRILRRGSGGLTLWRFWAVMNPHLLVLASCNGRPEAVERQRPVVDRVMMSIRLTNRDLLIGMKFTEAVASLAQDQFPMTAVAAIDEGHVRFGSRAVDLRMLHRRYLAEPGELSAHVRRFFAEVQRLVEGVGDGDLPREWEKASSRVMPVLATADRLSQYGPRCVHEEWINGLHIVYVVEEGEGEEAGGKGRGVTVEECREWGRDVEALHERAVENLVERSGELTMEGSRAQGYTMLALSTADPHNAARILLPDLYRKLREHLGQTFFVAIPSREFLLVFSTKRDDVLTRIRKQIASDYERAEHPVSPKLFQVTPDGIAGDPEESEEL